MATLIRAMPATPSIMVSFPALLVGGLWSPTMLLHSLTQRLSLAVSWTEMALIQKRRPRQRKIQTVSK